MSEKRRIYEGTAGKYTARGNTDTILRKKNLHVDEVRGVNTAQSEDVRVTGRTSQKVSR